MSRLRPSFVTLPLRRAPVPVLVASIAAVLAAPVWAANPPTALPTTPIPSLVSVSSAGEQGDAASYDPSISPDGRFVAFVSEACNLVPGDTNGGGDFGFGVDIFVRDRATGTTELVSVSSAGEQGTGDSYDPSISADGRFVAFYSDAGNLVAGDTNDEGDIFVRDRANRTTERVSVSNAGRQANSYSEHLSISGDGRFVAFDSDASNLVARDTNSWDDIFVRDRKKGTTERVSVSDAGRQWSGSSGSPSISADGRFVAFGSTATDLVARDRYQDDVFVRDRRTGTTKRVSISSAGRQGNGSSGSPSISADGRSVAFVFAPLGLMTGVGDSENSLPPFDEIYLRDRGSGRTERVSVVLRGRGRGTGPQQHAARQHSRDQCGHR